MLKQSIRFSPVIWIAVVGTLVPYSALAETPTTPTYSAIQTKAPELPTSNLGRKQLRTAPDLRVRQYQFVPSAKQRLRVQIVNDGNVLSWSNRLRITIRRLNGNPVGRTLVATVPSLGASESQWLVIDAQSLLPVDVALQDTTFRLDIDATGLVYESDESNNSIWHGL